jgi:hypothetical protein
MVIVLSILAALGIAVGAAWVLGSPRQQPNRAAEACWSTFAEHLDLNYDPGGLLKGPMISGVIKGMNVSMDTIYQVRDGRKAVVTRFVLHNESLPEGLDKTSKAKPTDDPIKRALAQVTRRHITELIKKLGATVAGKKVRWLRENAVWAPESTADVVRRIAQICEFLCLEETDISGRLLAGYRDESLPDGHREELKRLLFDSFPGSPESEAVAGDMLDDPDPNARLAAARALGPRGLDAMAKIARSAENPKEVRETALGEILGKQESSVALPLLASVIRSPNPEVSRTALAMIRRHKYLPAMRVLLEVTKTPDTPSDKICNIIDIIGEIGDSSAQPTLLSLLQHEFLMVRRRAASALGRVGTQNALAPLQQCASASGSNRRFKDLCQRAIERIRKRHRIPSDAPTAEAV